MHREVKFVSNREFLILCIELDEVSIDGHLAVTSISRRNSAGRPTRLWALWWLWVSQCERQLDTEITA